MLELKNVDIIVSNKYLIKSLSFTLNKKDKLAIIGEEGNGKSTLLKSILGICEYSVLTGIVNLKNNTIGYLEQSINNEDLNKTAYEFLFTSDNDYYNKINEFYKHIETINLNDTILNQKMKTLSGGEKTKVGILKLLLNNYDILFLDEPTSDLDIQTLEWLETFINKIDKPIIYISHDETLLSNTANMILHIEQRKKKQECVHTITKMSYDNYVQTRIKQINKQTQTSKREKREHDQKLVKLNHIMSKVEHEQNTITRADPHGAKILKKKMKTLKYQEKKLHNENLTEKPDIEENINFFFENVEIPNKKIILNMTIPELKIENKTLSKNIELNITGNKHICIIGKNGIGKSTLIKEIHNKIKTRTDIIVGYMPQDYNEIFIDNQTVLEFISKTNKIDQTTARKYLGNMNFTKEEMISKISNLSNGTKAKLILTKLVLEKCNVLILDEPTRNVSPLSNPIIRKVLKDFKGTIISVSHDRKYLNEVINEIYLLTEKGLQKIK